eukprot:2421481-Rhodomonas_salina.1
MRTTLWPPHDNEITTPLLQSSLCNQCARTSQKNCDDPDTDNMSKIASLHTRMGSHKAKERKKAIQEWTNKAITIFLHQNTRPQLRGRMLAMSEQMITSAHFTGLPPQDLQDLQDIKTTLETYQHNETVQ